MTLVLLLPVPVPLAGATARHCGSRPRRTRGHDRQESVIPSRPHARAHARALAALAAVTATAALAALAQPAAAAPPPAVPIDLETATVAQLDTLLAAKQTTSLAITQGYLERIQALSIGGPALNAVQTISASALTDAKAADAVLASGAAHGPLLGIPVLLKDNIDVKGIATTAGSVALQGNVAPADAPLVSQLRAAGAVILGKTKLTEFANFLTAGMPGGYSSLGGQVLNAYDVTQTPSGSSAGSGVAASVGLAPITFGSETSGSILSPANANSDVGVKPTVGLISRTGVIPISATQDTAGPLVKTVADAALALTATDLADPTDSASAATPLSGHDFTRDLNPGALAGARLGVVTTRTCLTALCDGTGGMAGTDYVDTSQRPVTPAGGTPPDTQVLYDNALAAMQAAGATLVPVRVRVPFIASPGSPDVLTYEFKRDLNHYLATRTSPGFGVKTLQDVIDYNNAHAAVALKFGQLQATTSQAVDLSPGSADTATYNANRSRDIAQSTGPINAALAGPDGVAGNADDVSSLIYLGSNSAGIGAKAQDPTVAVPAGYQTGQGTPPGSRRPINIGFLGAQYSEPTLIGLAYAYEQATRLRQPPSSINPTLYRCTALPGSPQDGCPAATIPVLPPDTSNLGGLPGIVPRAALVRVYGAQRVTSGRKGHRYVVKVFPSPLAPDVPVGGRLVGLYVDGVRRATLLTGRDGTIGYLVGFRPGRHTVTAVFFGAVDLLKGSSQKVAVSAR